jgi:hypothetical protein
MNNYFTDDKMRLNLDLKRNSSLNKCKINEKLKKKIKFKQKYYEIFFFKNDELN